MRLLLTLALLLSAVAAEAVTLDSQRSTCLPLGTLAVSVEEACAIIPVTHKLVCWGDDTNGTTVSDATTVAVDSVSADEFAPRQVCAVRSDNGHIDCWGCDAASCGGIDYHVESDAPVDQAYTQVTAMGPHVFCAIKASDGTLKCWGTSDGCEGEIDCVSLGTDNPPDYVGTYDTDPEAAGAFVQIDGSASEVGCGVKTDGSLACFGKGTAAVDGAADIDAIAYLYANIPAGTTYDHVSVGDQGAGPRACAHKTDNTVVCWGSDNADGENTIPVGGTYTQVVALQTASCGIKVSNSKPECWGAGTILTEPNITMTQISGAKGGVCGLAAGRRIRCWGDDSSNSGHVITTSSCQPPHLRGWVNN